MPETENAAALSLDDDERDAGDAPLEDPAQCRLHDVARAIEQDLRVYCASRAEGASLVEQGLKQLRLSIFRKAKYPVDEELWIPGAAPPGQQQYVETFVCETHVLHHANAHLSNHASGDGSAQTDNASFDWRILDEDFSD